MPRLSTVDTCMICAPDPCECSGKKKSKTQPKKKRPEQIGPQAEALAAQTPEVAPVRRASMRDKMKAAAAQAPPELSAAFSGDTTPQARAGRIAPRQPSLPTAPSDPTSDELLAIAIRNLAPILHEEELKRYAVIIGSQPTTKDRAAFWRARQGGSPDGTTP